ncbi:MAG: hypothetical protein RE472_03030 [Thermoplasmatales archaeon]|nr:MAG: hypothetical protein RE472_09900 [Thermoplasmatales archaeon]WMT49952.1 MAG: hypothetical protein RE472_03030 [Thermoplasmatales archaeon]
MKETKIKGKNYIKNKINAILSVFSSIFGSVMDLFQGTMSMLINVAVSTGPFALPLFFMGSAGVIGAGYLGFQLIKDLPIVGAIA